MENFSISKKFHSELKKKILLRTMFVFIAENEGEESNKIKIMIIKVIINNNYN